MEQRTGFFIRKISGLSRLENIITTMKYKRVNSKRICGGGAQLLDREESKRKRNFAESEAFTVGKIEWIIECTREDDCYCFYLGMINEEGDIEADYSIRIMSKKPEVADINENETSLDRRSFNPECYKVPFYGSKDVSDFMADDSIEFQVSIAIKRMAFIGCVEVDFSRPTKLSDIVLLIGGREIHGNRQFLSMHSNVFEEMFSNNEETTFEINDIDESFESIIELCRCIYPGADLLADDLYLGYIQKAAEKFDMQYVRNVVTELLMTENGLVDEKGEDILFTKYAIADKHNLKELHAHILNSMTQQEIKNFLIRDKHKERYMKLSRESKKVLVERHRNMKMDNEKSEEVEDCHTVDFSMQTKYSDVCLVVEGKKIYVNKTYLAIHSPMFEAMFFSSFKEKDQKEVHLKDVKHDVFVDVLTLIDPQAQIRVQKEKVCDLLEVADRFDIQRVCYLVERFLMNSTEMDDCEKLEIAERYLLKNLQKLMMKKAKREGNENV